MEKHETISFELGGLLFEFDRKKQEQNLKNTGFHFVQRLGYSLMKTILKHMMMITQTENLATT